MDQPRETFGGCLINAAIILAFVAIAAALIAWRMLNFWLRDKWQ